MNKIVLIFLVSLFSISQSYSNDNILKLKLSLDSAGSWVKHVRINHRNVELKKTYVPGVFTSEVAVTFINGEIDVEVEGSLYGTLDIVIDNLKSNTSRRLNRDLIELVPHNGQHTFYLESLEISDKNIIDSESLLYTSRYDFFRN